MAIVNNWNVVALDCYPEFEGEKDCVFNVHYTLNAVDGDYTGSVYGSVGVTLDAESPFTPYDQLTEQQVLGWVWESGVDKDASEANVAQQIANQINPPVVTPPLPWATPQEPAVE